MKGEFEKQPDYAERLKQQSKINFDKTCLEQIKNKITSINDCDVILSSYNPDNEYFIVILKRKGIEYQSKINVPIAVAEKFKNNWSNFKKIIDDADWCFVDNTLCPTLVTLQDNEDNKYTVLYSYKNQSEIDYSFDNLGIINTYLKGYTFKYSAEK